MPQTAIWWVNLMFVSLSLGLALAGLLSYLTGPSEALRKVITPFVSLISAFLVFSAFVTVATAIANGIVTHTIIP